jgi:hypothetical protein
VKGLVKGLRSRDGAAALPLPTRRDREKGSARTRHNTPHNTPPLPLPPHTHIHHPHIIPLLPLLSFQGTQRRPLGFFSFPPFFPGASAAHEKERESVARSASVVILGEGAGAEQAASRAERARSARRARACRSKSKRAFQSADARACLCKASPKAHKTRRKEGPKRGGGVKRRRRAGSPEKRTSTIVL